MRLDEMRLNVATALNAVPDVTGHRFRPAAPAIGDGWPLFASMERAAGTAFLATWRVRVALPSDEESASTWMDGHWDALYYALEPLGFVQRMLPTLLPTSSGDLYALEITMITEE